MIVDGKGNIFEDRRKPKDNRRKTECDIEGGRRKVERRKAPEQIDKKK